MMEKKLNRRDVLKVLASVALPVVTHQINTAGPKEKQHEMTDEEFVDFHIQQLRRVYNIEITFSTNVSIKSRRANLEAALFAVSKYPPNFINTMMALYEADKSSSNEAFFFRPEQEHQRTKALRIQINSDEEFPYEGAAAVAYRLSEARNVFRANLFQVEFSTAFFHELAHNIHESICILNFVSQKPEEMPVESYWTKLAERLGVGGKPAPFILFRPEGFASMYAATNNKENFAETISYLIGYPYLAIQEVINNPRSELATKLIAVADILYIISGGLMDAQYWRDSITSNINFEYWLNKEKSPDENYLGSESRFYYYVQLPSQKEEDKLESVLVCTEDHAKDEAKTQQENFEEYKNGDSLTIAGRQIRVKISDRGADIQGRSHTYLGHQLADDDSVYLGMIPYDFSDRMKMVFSTIDTTEEIELFVERDGTLMIKRIKNYPTKDFPLFNKYPKGIGSTASQIIGGSVLGNAALLIDEIIDHQLRKRSTRRNFLKNVVLSAFVAGTALASVGLSKFLNNAAMTVTPTTEIYENLHKKFWFFEQ